MHNKFGLFLKKLRLDRNMTLRDVEKEAKISNAYLSQLENGTRGIPTIKTIQRLAKAYGISFEKLTSFASAYSEEPLAGTNISSPETDFICRGYENLSEENKITLKKFLQYLEKDEKKN